MNHPQFSIIIPTFRRIDLLKECLLSIYAQDFKDFEIIVVDDDSDSLVYEMTRKEFPEVHYYSQKGKGPGAARNLGASHAKGLYLTFVDDDDLLHKTYLSAVSQILQSDASTEMIFVQHRDFSCPIAWQEFADKQRQDLSYTRYENIMDYMLADDAFCGTAVWAALKKCYFSSTDGFVTGKVNMEDVEWLLRSSNIGNVVKINEPVLLGYRLHKNQVTTSVMKSHKGLMNILRSEISNRYPAIHYQQRMRRVNQSLQCWLSKYTPSMFMHFLYILHLGFRAFGLRFLYLLPSCIYSYIKGCFRYFQSFQSYLKSYLRPYLKPYFESANIR
jgi:glycosyltransferase involved in cell wall biosynthesis